MVQSFFHSRPPLGKELKGRLSRKNVLSLSIISQSYAAITQSIFAIKLQMVELIFFNNRKQQNKATISKKENIVQYKTFFSNVIIP